MYLRVKDYLPHISDSDRDVLTDSTDSILDDIELAVKEEISAYIRHRYDVDQIFKVINTFNITTQYHAGDLVEWSETAYNAETTYDTDDRCSYSDNIYECKENGITGVWTSSKWTLLAENESLHYCLVASLGNIPSDTITYTANNYTGNHKSITGWDRATYTLYFLKDDNRVEIYFNESARTARTSMVGFFDYDKKAIDLPITIEIQPGYGTNNYLGGYIDIIGFIDDDTTWSVVATNCWQAGDNRNPAIIQFMIDMVLYHLCARGQYMTMTDMRKERYDGNDPRQIGGAVGFLKQVSKGNVTLDVKRHNDNEQGQRFIYGSSRKQSNDY